MQVITKMGHIRIMVQMASTDTMFDLVQRKLVATELINQVILIYFQNSFFSDGPNRYEFVHDWIERFLLEAGAMPDMIRFYDGELDEWIRYPSTATSDQPLVFSQALEQMH